MPLYSISDGNTGWASDVDQIIDGITGKNDIGDITAYPQIAAPGAPTVAASATAGVLTGAYKYAVAFVTGYWQGPTGTGTLLTQGNTGGGTVSATVSPSAKQVNLTNIPIGGPGVVARILYRTKANGSTYYQLAQINDNTTTAWTDNIPDANLVTLMPAENTTGSRFVGDGSGLTNLPTDYTKQIPYAVTSGAPGPMDSYDYTVSTVPALAALVPGVAITIKSHIEHKNSAKLNWDGTGQKNIKKANGDYILDFKLNGVYTLRYNGTDFVLQGDNGLDAHLADFVSQPANGGTTGGTATAYTCSSTPAPTALVDKIGVVITAHVDSGANPTLNWDSKGAKPIKKPNGNAAILKAGGIYTLRYNATSGNFILQGEGGEYGTAGVGDVRSTKTIGTENGIAQGTLDLANLIADNLKKDVIIDGVTGTHNKVESLSAGENVIATDLVNNHGKTNTSYVKIVSFKINSGGTIRVSFDLATSSTARYGFGRIYVNGVAVGTERSTNASLATPVTFTEDITVNAGDSVAMYIKIDTSGYTVYLKNFTIKTIEESPAVLDYYVT